MQSLGAKGGIVLDNVKGSSANDSPLFAMSGDGTDDVSIPMLFLFNKDAEALLKAVADDEDIEVTMQESFRKSLIIVVKVIKSASKTAHKTHAVSQSLREKVLQIAQSQVVGRGPKAAAVAAASESKSPIRNYEWSTL